MGRFTRKIAIAAAAPIVLIGVAMATTTTASAAESAHVVKPGETLSSIAAADGTSVSHLVSLNNIANPDLIFAGQTLYLTGTNHSDTGHSSAAVYYTPPAQQSAPPQAAPAQSSGAQDSSALSWIAAHESTNNPNAVNSSSGAYGLFQFLPSTPGAPAPGASVADQYSAAHSYAVSRYGSDEAAKAFWEANGWW